MKTKMFALFSFALLALVSISTPALAIGGKPVVLAYATTNVTTSAYVQLIGATVKGSNAMSVINSGSSAVEIAFGAAGSEVVQAVIPATALTVQPVVIPLGSNYGTRISVIAVGGSNSTGSLQLNYFYN